VQVLTQQATQREAAETWGVDRSTVIGICRTAKQGALDALAAAVPGRPGVSAEAAALVEARAEVQRLRATVTEQQPCAARWAGEGLSSSRRHYPNVPRPLRRGVLHGCASRLYTASMAFALCTRARHSLAPPNRQEF
jgi:transposase-like protein